MSMEFIWMDSILRGFTIGFCKICSGVSRYVFIHPIMQFFFYIYNSIYFLQKIEVIRLCANCFEIWRSRGIFFSLLLWVRLLSYCWIVTYWDFEQIGKKRKKRKTYHNVRRGVQFCEIYLLRYPLNQCYKSVVP